MSFILIFVLGSLIGSFLNVVILRLHNGGDIVNARSKCPSCQHLLMPLDLIPIVSFVIQRGKCRYCQSKISWQYPLVELFTALLFLLVYVVHATNLNGGDINQLLVLSYKTSLLIIRDLIFVSFLVVIFVYDLRWYLILDRVTFFGMAIAIILNLILGISWISLLLGVVIGFGFFAFQFVISKGTWIGGGDLRLGALMGLMLGARLVVVALFFSYIIGSVISIFLVIWGAKKFKSQVPFGTFLAIGTIIALLWGDVMVNWYLGLM